MKYFIAAMVSISFFFSVLSSAYGLSLVSQGLDSSAYYASSTYLDFFPEYAFNGEQQNYWNSGGGLQAWIEVDLQSSFSITEIVLTVAQLPAGYTNHTVYASNEEIKDYNRINAVQITELFNFTDSGDVFHISLEDSFSSVYQYVQVFTDYSPSWVAWAGIEIYAEVSTKPVPEPSTLFLLGTGLVFLCRRKIQGLKKI